MDPTPFASFFFLMSRRSACMYLACRYLRDSTMASTILDRLLHRSKLIEFEGKSYRLREAAARLAVTEESDA
jgi:DNA replication protein DnaC